MKNVVRYLLPLVMLIVLASVAYRVARANSPQAASQKTNSYEVVHIYHCQMRENVTEVQVEASLQALLKARKAMPGSEGVKIQAWFPVAVTDMGERDFSFAVITPTFTAWGKGWDAFTDDSPVAKWEVKLDAEGPFDCPSSAIWQADNIEEK
jgi:hypothetical protein